MTILSKGCRTDNFKLYNSLKLNLTYTRGLRSNFVKCESFLESNSHDILALCETNLDDSVDSGKLSVRGYLPLIQKYVWFCSLRERRTSFCTGLISRTLCEFLITLSTGFTSLSALLLFYNCIKRLLIQLIMIHSLKSWNILVLEV